MQATGELVQWTVTFLRTLVLELTGQNNDDDLVRMFKKRAMTLARDQLGESIELFAQVDVPFTESFLESVIKQTLGTIRKQSEETVISESYLNDGEHYVPISDTKWYQRMVQNKIDKDNTSTIDDSMTKHDLLMHKIWSFVGQRLEPKTREKVYKFLDSRFIRSPAWASLTTDDDDDDGDDDDDDDGNLRSRVQSYTRHLASCIIKVLDEEGASKSVLFALVATLSVICVDGLSPFRPSSQENRNESDSLSTIDDLEYDSSIAEFQNWYEFICPLVEMMAEAYLHPERWIPTQAVSLCNRCLPL